MHIFIYLIYSYCLSGDVRWHRRDGAGLTKNFIVSCQGRKSHREGPFSSGLIVRTEKQNPSGWFKRKRRKEKRHRGKKAGKLSDMQWGSKAWDSLVLRAAEQNQTFSRGEEDVSATHPALHSSHFVSRGFFFPHDFFPSSLPHLIDAGDFLLIRSQSLPLPLTCFEYVNAKAGC